jgi:hypothetical protein
MVQYRVPLNGTITAFADFWIHAEFFFFLNDRSPMDDEEVASMPSSEAAVDDYLRRRALSILPPDPQAIRKTLCRRAETDHHSGSSGHPLIPGSRQMLFDPSRTTSAGPKMGAEVVPRNKAAIGHGSLTNHLSHNQVQLPSSVNPLNRSHPAHGGCYGATSSNISYTLPLHRTTTSSSYNSIHSCLPGVSWRCVWSCWPVSVL